MLAKHFKQWQTENNINGDDHDFVEILFFLLLYCNFIEKKRKKISTSAINLYLPFFLESEGQPSAIL